MNISNGSTLSTIVKDECYYYVEGSPLPYGLGELAQLKSFIKYIKTQSKRLDSKIGRQDVYFVMQVMLNRMDDNNCPDWNHYYRHQSINNSESIRKLKTGELSPSFSLTDEKDSELIKMLYLILSDELSSQYRIDKNCLYFESLQVAPNSGPHRKDKLLTKARHRFYCK